MQKIVSGAIQAAIAAAITLPIVLLVPSTPVHLHVHWLVLVTVLPLSCMLAGALGLTIGTRVEPRPGELDVQHPRDADEHARRRVLPVVALGPVPWLKWLVLVNPLVYMCEGFRAAHDEHPAHVVVAVYGALIGFTVVLVRLGIDGFRKRVLT